MRSVNNPFDTAETVEPNVAQQMMYGRQIPMQGSQAMGGKLQTNNYDDIDIDDHRHHNNNDPNKQHSDTQSRTPSWILNMCNCFPLRIFSFFGGVALVVCTILDTLFNNDTMIQFFLRVYLVFFGVIIMLIESPRWSCTTYFQLKIFFWYRILSRMWGRAWLYLFVTVLCFGEFDRENAAEFTIVAGFYMFFVSVTSFVFSKLAAAKYNRMFEYVVGGSEGDELIARLEYKFDEIAPGSMNEEGYMGALEITSLAHEAGRGLSNSERHAIQTYLDESCNGFVTKDDFVHQFHRLTLERQRFL